MDQPLYLYLTNCVIDTRQQLANLGDKSVRLTTKELQLLLYLSNNPGRTIPREELLVEVWDYDPSAYTRAADNMIRKLRSKVELDTKQPVHIHTVHGEGYRFEPLSDVDDLSTSLPKDPTEPNDSGGTNIGTDWTEFFGRHTEQARLRELLSARQALVTITGPAGIGKTRLATLIGRQLYEAQTFERVVLVELSEVHEAQRLLEILCEAMQVQGTATPTIERLGASLSARGSMLLIMDNVEQIREETLILLNSLRPLAPQTSFLLTSQHRLKVSGERTLKLGPLLPQDGRALFLARATSSGVLADDETLNHGLVDRVASRLEGLPLALELAAARVELLGLQGLSERLDQHLDALSQSSSTPRHGSLRVAFNNSWELLSTDEQRALCLCSMFEGGFCLEAAEAVCLRLTDLGNNGLSLVHSLIDKSIFYVKTSQVTGTRRIFLYTAIRTYAREQALANGWATLFRDHHLQWAAATCFEAHRSYNEDSLLLELYNILAAIDWATKTKSPLLCELAIGQSRNANSKAAISHAIRQLEEAISSHPGEARIGFCHIELAKHFGRSGKFSKADTELNRAREVQKTQPSPGLEARIDFGEAELCIKRGSIAQACTLLKRACEKLIEPEDAALRAILRTNMAMIHLRHGQPEQAVQLLMAIEGEELGALCRSVRSRILTAAAQVQHFSGYPAVAAEKISAAISLTSKGTVLHIKMLALLGSYQTDLGDLEQSRLSLEQALALSKEQASPPVEALVLQSMSQYLLRAGRFAEALAVSEQVSMVFSRHKVGVSTAIAKYSAGHALLQMGQVKHACARYEQGLAQFNDQAPREAALGCLYLASACSGSDAGLAKALLERGEALLPRPGLYGEVLLLDVVRLALKLAALSGLEPQEAMAGREVVAAALAKLKQRREYGYSLDIRLFTDFLESTLATSHSQS